jgi:hypothetical protein
MSKNERVLKFPSLLTTQEIDVKTLSIFQSEVKRGAINHANSKPLGLILEVEEENITEGDADTAPKTKPVR